MGQRVDKSPNAAPAFSSTHPKRNVSVWQHYNVLHTGLTYVLQCFESFSVDPCLCRYFWKRCRVCGENQQKKDCFEQSLISMRTRLWCYHCTSLDYSGDFTIHRATAGSVEASPGGEGGLLNLKECGVCVSVRLGSSPPSHSPPPGAIP